MIDHKDLTSEIIAIANTLDDDLSPVSSSQDTFASMRIDSLGFVKLLVGIEQAFQFEFDERDLDLSQYEKIDDLITVVRRYVE